MTIEQLTAQRQVESLDLARGGRGRRLGEPVRERVLPADLGEQHLPALTEPIRELFAIQGGTGKARTSSRAQACATPLRGANPCRARRQLRALVHAAARVVDSNQVAVPVTFSDLL
jgi:hypothetical protein